MGIGSGRFAALFLFVDSRSCNVSLAEKLAGMGEKLFEREMGNAPAMAETLSPWDVDS